MRPVTAAERRRRSWYAKRRWREVPAEERSEYARDMALAAWEYKTPEERRAHGAMLQESRRKAEAERERCPVCREPGHFSAVCAKCLECAARLKEFGAERLYKSALLRLLELCEAV